MRKRYLLAPLTAALLLAGGAGAQAADGTIYDAIPGSLPPNVVSLGFQANQTSEFGDRITFGAGSRAVQTVTVTMSSWALSTTEATAFNHPITVNLYQVAGAGEVGDLIETVTQTVAVPFRPAADPTCADPSKWRASDGSCNNGLAFNVDFDLNGVTVPDEIIFGIAYDTQSYGKAPIGVDGPYNSLNVGILAAPAVPAAGTDFDPDAVFWNTSHAPNYTDDGAAGVGVFREDTNWSPYGTVAARFETVATDTVPPAITWGSGIADGDSFVFGQVPAEPTCTALDDTSGPVTCVVTGYSEAVGSHTLTATATDGAGNTATETRAYSVSAWSLDGFYQPVDMGLNVWNTVKGGSTVPLKFEAFAGSTELNEVGVVSAFTQKRVTCPGGENVTEDPIEVTTTGATSLRYDATEGQFIQNWKTPKSPGACYQITMTTDDGSSISANFKLK